MQATVNERMRMKTTRLALIGAGAIGRAHLTGALHADGVQVIGLADPSPEAELLANEFGVPHYPDHQALATALKPDGAIIAAPNALHVPIALDFIASGTPVLVEKPVADTVEEGMVLAAASKRFNVPVLVGHHRRHNPIIQKARALIQRGELGRIVAINVLATFLKPDSYFVPAWRRSPSGGPVLINLTHEIDLIRFLCGEVSDLYAITSNAVRGHEVEDTAAVALRLASGTLATIVLSDTAASPWSWDLSSGENPAFPRSSEDSHLLCGTDGSLALPSLRHWRYAGERGWHHSLSESSVAFDAASPYVEQARHFGAVVRREELPVVDAMDATRTLKVTLAIRAAAASGGGITFD